MEPAPTPNRFRATALRSFCCGSLDGRRIEAVYIPDTPAQTFCISTQVGCAMACGFPLTGKMGLVRHLTAGEIVGQSRVLARETGLSGTAFNIVLMGMGEPLHNYDATMKALRILTDKEGLAIPPRRITLSTAGAPPGLESVWLRKTVMLNLGPYSCSTPPRTRATRCTGAGQSCLKLQELMDACRDFPSQHASPLRWTGSLRSGQRYAGG